MLKIRKINSFYRIVTSSQVTDSHRVADSHRGEKERILKWKFSSKKEAEEKIKYLIFKYLILAHLA